MAMIAVIGFMRPSARLNEWAYGGETMIVRPFFSSKASARVVFVFSGGGLVVGPFRVGVAAEVRYADAEMCPSPVYEVLRVLPEVGVLFDECDDDEERVLFDEEDESGVAVDVGAVHGA
jgi:hypothetical protein